jgi:hypothetical protein
MRARAGNMSAATEWRLARDGKGPPRIKLSDRRWGYPEDLFNEWLKSRFQRPLPAEGTGRWEPWFVRHAARNSSRESIEPSIATIAGASATILQRFIGLLRRTGGLT